jgi:large subunit ribosomal protein L35
MESNPRPGGFQPSFYERTIKMPKMKTHRGAAKRFSKTGTGKLRRGHAFHSHILTKKSPGRKAQLAGETSVSKANEKTVNRMIPYL